MLLALLFLSVCAYSQTARHYFKEMQENGGTPGWATHICYYDDPKDQGFFLLAMNNPDEVRADVPLKVRAITFQRYYKGVPLEQDADTTILHETGIGEWHWRQELHAANHFGDLDLTITRGSLRYRLLINSTELTAHSVVRYGKCEEIPKN